MVGPGANYAQMITGDFIPARHASHGGDTAASDSF
jgi:acetolactate synthase-1/2/3 large subunit